MAYRPAFEARNDLARYGPNALLLFALELQYQIGDIHSVAADSLTDGSDDKKCDLIYIDVEVGVAVIAQSYFARDPSRREAPANKASDLNTAVGWLLLRDLNDIPEGIRPAAAQLRSALLAGKVKSLQLWYVHNLPESKNVEHELRTVELAAVSGLRQVLSPAGDLPDVRAREVGQQYLDELYDSLTSPILVNDELSISVPGAFILKGRDWESCVTAVPARWLFDLFRQYQDRLFSANVRGYLGSRKADVNINNGIKKTASAEPSQFWVYNNGITVLVNEMEYCRSNSRLTLKGLSIVNGAQTTGAIGSLSQSPEGTALVPARFVRCQNQDTIQSIIRYNNSQNRVEAPDFRSNDAVQRRLRAEFSGIPNVTYLGGRRGGYEDRIRRPGNLLPSDTAGQALAAFHGDPIVAYNEKSRIWVSDVLYSRFFFERTTAKHIVFTYSLLRTIEDKRNSLRERSTLLTSIEQQQLAFLRQRGAIFLLTTAIGASVETILAQAVIDKFTLRYDGSTSPADAMKMWAPIVNALVAFNECLVPAVDGGLNSLERVKQSVREFGAFVSATATPNEVLYRTFTGNVVWG